MAYGILSFICLYMEYNSRKVFLGLYEKLVGCNASNTNKYCQKDATSADEAEEIYKDVTRDVEVQLCLCYN